MKKVVVAACGLAVLSSASWLASVSTGAATASVFHALLGPAVVHAADLDGRASSRRTHSADEESHAVAADEPSDELELRIGDGPLAPPAPPLDESAPAEESADITPAALPLPLPRNVAPSACHSETDECSLSVPAGEDVFERTPQPARRSNTVLKKHRPASRAADLFVDSARSDCPGGVCEVPRSIGKLAAARQPHLAEPPVRSRQARRASVEPEDQSAAVRRASQQRPSEPAAPLSTGNASSGVTVEWLVPREVNLGEAVACQLVVHNRGASEALDVAVKVALPEHVRFEGADPEPQADGDHLTWHVGQMSGDQSQTILVRLAPQTEGNFTPRAAVTFTQSTAAEIRVAQPELALAVSGPEQASVGQSAAYQFQVTNRGAGAAVNVVVHAKIDPSFEHPQGERVEYRLGMLAAGETRTVEAVLSGREHGEFEVLGAVTAGDHVLARATHLVQIARPRLELALEGPGRRFVDRKANYLVQIHNPGPAVAENVHVTQEVPDGFRFVQSTPGGSYDARLRQVGWFVGRLEADETAEVGLQLIPTEVGQHLLTAEVQADAGVIGSAELETRVDGVSAVVLEVIDMDDPVEVAGRTAYQLRVSNQGSIPARRVQVGARVPGQLRITDATGPTAGDIRDQQVAFDHLDRLEPGEARVFHVYVECLEAGQATFRGFVRSDDQDQPTTVEELTRVYED